LLPPQGDDGVALRCSAPIHTHGMETPLCIRLPRPPDLDAPAEHQPTGSE
jgi:hypothetical protein